MIMTTINQVTEFRESWGVHPRTHLSRALTHRLQSWIVVLNAPGRTDEDKLARPKATAAIAIYDDALCRLEASKKTGARADAAREQIRAARAPLAAAVELVDSIGYDFGGVLGIDLQNRIAGARADLLAALAAKELATRSTVEAALLSIEQCWADVREIDRDLASIYERLIVPPLGDIDALRSAEYRRRSRASPPWRYRHRSRASPPVAQCPGKVPGHHGACGSFNDIHRVDRQWCQARGSVPRPLGGCSGCTSGNTSLRSLTHQAVAIPRHTGDRAPGVRPLTHLGPAGRGQLPLYQGRARMVRGPATQAPE